MFLLEIIGDRMKEDRQHGRDGSWRLREYEKVPYADMVHKFWKNLDSFYPDKSFLE